MKRPITPKGYDALRNELLKFKSMRPELAGAIEVARGHGDLSENGDYDAAKEKSGMIEAKIRDLEVKLANADIIDPTKIGEPTRVTFGVTVTVQDVDSGEEKKLSILGPDESNIELGWISCESPLARSLIGKEVGEIAKFEGAGKVKEYEVMELEVYAG